MSLNIFINNVTIWICSKTQHKLKCGSYLKIGISSKMKSTINNNTGCPKNMEFNDEFDIVFVMN